MSSRSASRPSRAIALAATLAASAFAAAPEARACAVCASGAPTQAPEPSPARLSFFADARAGEARVAGLWVGERRLETGLSYNFTVLSEELGADIGLPVLFRTVSAGSGAVDVVSPGDLETRLRYLAKRTPSLSVSLYFGAKWPTAPVGTFAGSALPSALQPGCSGIAPLLGAVVARAHGPWTFSGAGQVLLPFAVRDAPHQGDSVRIAGGIERRLTDQVATRVTLTLRAETGGRLEADAPDPDSGGAVLYVTTEAVLRPAPRVSGSVGVSFPAVQGWLGVRRESPVAALSLALSL